MSDLFKGVQTGGEDQGDRVGGFVVHDSDIYLSTVKALYAGAAKSGARFVHAILELNGAEYNETFYYTSKEGRTFYEREGKKVNLPGFSLVDHLLLITTGNGLLDQKNVEDKILNVYDPDQKKQLPKSVPVFTDATGKQVLIGLLKNIEDKTKKNESTNEYEPTGETRETNNVDKVFDVDSKKTVTEALNGEAEAKFYDTWLNANKGKVKNKAKGSDNNGKTGRPGSNGAPQSGGGEQKTSSLFKKN